MTDKLPPPISGLLAPRPPLRHFSAPDYPSERRCTRHITGVGAFVSIKFVDDYVATKTAQEAKEIRRRMRRQSSKRQLEAKIMEYDPFHDEKAHGDPYKTLFLARMSYAVTENDLQSAFARFGKIEDLQIVRRKNSEKSRGYAFIVFAHERDMRAAYHEANGIMLKGRKICVDVERGRTVKNWLPRRLGGGLGGRHYTKARVNSFKQGGYDRYESRNYPRRQEDRRDDRSFARPRFREEGPRLESHRPRNAGIGYRGSSFRPEDSSFRPRESLVRSRESSFRPRESSFRPRDADDYRKRRRNE